MASGHKVFRLREYIVDTSPDPIVAETCRQSGLVLITHNIKHFRQIAKQYEVTKKQVDRLCRIEMGCEQAIAEKRIRDALSIIELEYARLGSSPEGLRVFIGDSVIRTHR